MAAQIERLNLLGPKLNFCSLQLDLFFDFRLESLPLFAC